MKAVIDTNVWLDWLVFDDPGIGPLRQWVADGRVRLLGTAATRAELADVLQRPQFHARMQRDLAQALQEYDRTISVTDEPAACDLPCRDPDDQVFIDLAVAQGADWLVTKDKELLRLAGPAQRRHRLTIARPTALPVPGEPG